MRMATWRQGSINAASDLPRYRKRYWMGDQLHFLSDCEQSGCVKAQKHNHTSILGGGPCDARSTARLLALVGYAKGMSHRLREASSRLPPIPKRYFSLLVIPRSPTCVPAFRLVVHATIRLVDASVSTSLRHHHVCFLGKSRPPLRRVSELR